MFTRKKQQAHLVDKPLDAEIQRYSGHRFTARDYANGTLVIGASGSGKSSGPMQSMILGLLTASPKMGGIFTTAKQDDLPNLMRLIQYAGREKDVIVVDASGKYRINWLEYARQQTPKGSSEAVTINETFTIFREMENKVDIYEGDSFWHTHVDKFVVAASNLLICAGETVSVKKFVKILRSMPRSPEDTKSDDFISKSYVIHLIDKACQLHPDDERLDNALSYILEEMVYLDQRTRSNVESTIHAALFPASTGLAPLVLDDVETNFTPEITFEGKIIILDFPGSVYQTQGNRIIAMIYYLWMKDVMKRDLTQSNRMVFSVVDECQLYINRYMIHFSSVCRSQQAICVYATQSIASITVRLGKNGKDLLEQWTGNLSFKYMLSSTETSSLRFCADLIGKDYDYRMGFSANMNDGVSGSNASEEYRYLIPEKEFRLLPTGGERHNYTVVAVMICAGRTFNGESYMRIAFDQRLD